MDAGVSACSTGAGVTEPEGKLDAAAPLTPCGLVIGSRLPWCMALMAARSSCRIPSPPNT